MAADRASLASEEERMRAGGRGGPRMEWWTWERPTISLGFLQPALAVNALGRPVVRRPTGGGAILHDQEWTYSALVPRAHPRLGGTLDAATRALTTIVARALASAYGIVVDAAPPTEADAGAGAAAVLLAGEPRACFARCRGYELAVGGRKLMGSAQRRGRHVLLQQGSLLVGPGHERLARHLPEVAGDIGDAEARLRVAAVTLTELLGRAPDPRPFRVALAAAWSTAASGLREAPRGALDSVGAHS